MLRSFVHTLLDGSCIDQPPPQPTKSNVAISIGQQIISNTVRHRSKKLGSIPRHVKEREMPSPVYLTMKLHLQTSSASLIDVMHKRGLCISYDRLKVFRTDITISVISLRLSRMCSPQVGFITLTTTHHLQQQHQPSKEHASPFSSISLQTANKLTISLIF